MLVSSKFSYCTNSTAVFSESGANFGFHRDIQNRRSAQVPLPLLRNSDVTVAGAGRAMLGLARSRNSETFFHTLVGLHFGHDLVPVRPMDIGP